MGSVSKQQLNASAKRKALLELMLKEEGIEVSQAERIPKRSGHGSFSSAASGLVGTATICSIMVEFPVPSRSSLNTNISK